MRAVAAALAAHYGLAPVHLTPLPGGFIHRVWRVDAGEKPRAVKLYRGENWAPARVAPTLAVQAYAAAAGLPVPAVHRTAAGEWLAPAAGGWVAVFDLASGWHLGEYELTPAAAAGTGTVLGRLHRTLAAMPADQAAPAIPDTAAVREMSREVLALAEASPARDAMDQLAAAAARYRLQALERRPIDPARYLDAPYQLVHGDYYPGNLLFGPGGAVAAVLDWDFARVNWRGIEVGRAMVESALAARGGLDRERAQAFLRAYLAEQPLPAGERRQMCQMWYDYLLASLYPLPQRYRPEATLPRGWAQLARRRHRLLVLLGRHLDQLAEWAAGV